MKTILAASIVCLLSVSVASAQQPKPAEAIGTWKLNIAKSKYSPGPAPSGAASQVRRLEIRKDGFTVLMIFDVDSQGTPAFTEYVYKPDGKDYPGYSQTTLADFLAAGTKGSTTTVKFVDDYTAIVQTKNAKGVSGSPITRVVSQDGKTQTLTTKFKNAQGQTVENVTVYDRVK